MTDGEALAALCPAATEDLPAIFGGHSCPKSVFVSSLAIMRLKCSLHVPCHSSDVAQTANVECTKKKEESQGTFSLIVSAQSEFSLGPLISFTNSDQVCFTTQFARPGAFLGEFCNLFACEGGSSLLSLFMLWGVCFLWIICGQPRHILFSSILR